MHFVIAFDCRATARRLAAACLWPLGMGLAQSQEALVDRAPVVTTTSTRVDADTWRFQVTPYVWMTGMSGDIRAASSVPAAHVSQSFSDVLSNLDAAAFLSGTARKGRSVFLADASYASLSDSASMPMGLKAQARVKKSVVSLAGGYNWELSPRDSLDALVGLRWWDIRATVQIQPLLQAQAQESFVDPIVALRWRHQWSDRWSTLVYADVGGLGVGSDFAWQLLAVGNYQWRENIFVSVGYRQLNVDYRHGGRRLNFGMGGPVLGATLRF